MSNPATLTLRVLARLLSYPDAELRDHLGDLSAALHSEQALGAARLGELDALLKSMRVRDPIEMEADYVQLFDHHRLPIERLETAKAHRG